MKIIFTLISIIILLIIIFLAALNTQTLFDITAWGLKPLNVIHIAHVSVFEVISWAFIGGILMGSCWASSFYNRTQSRLKEYQKKLEKTSVQSSGDVAKIDVLEAKIATLEKALESALKQSD